MERIRAGMRGRCPTCKIHKALCFCDQISENFTPEKISIIMHVTEKKLTSNTAWLAQKILANCDLHIRGEVNNKFIASDILDNNYIPLFLFPSSESVPLTSEFINNLQKPAQLIIPDGNWHQAKKVKSRERDFHPIQAVHLEQVNDSIYSLRKSPFDGALCTIEAIGHALQVFGRIDAYENIMNVLKIMVDRTQYLRSGIST